MYFFVCYMMIRAIVTHQILWPQKGEDRDEGGFEIHSIKPESEVSRENVMVWTSKAWLVDLIFDNIPTT